MIRLPCCATWDDNELLAETPLMRAALDAYPVVPGHVLVYPKRHVDRLVDLAGQERLDLIRLISLVQDLDGDHTIAINDGPHAGRTVPHLHVHVIPRRAGDVPDPRGGVRQLFVAPAQDPWINREAKALEELIDP